MTNSTPTHAPLPCPNPWCASHGDLPDDVDGRPMLYHGLYQSVCFGCSICSMKGPIAATEPEALAAWNQRAGSGEVAWRGMDSAPKDRYFLACVMAEKSEAMLFKSIFGWDRDEANYRHVIVASLRPKQRKGRVFMAVTGQPFWATHWMELPDFPVFNEKDLPRDY